LSESLAMTDRLNAAVKTVIDGGSAEKLNESIAEVKAALDMRDVDNLSVWCAVCQKEMELITGPNIVKGWYRCDRDQAFPHAVVISEQAAGAATAESKKEDGAK
jgi:hypothetical protein